MYIARSFEELLSDLEQERLRAEEKAQAPKAYRQNKTNHKFSQAYGAARADAFKQAIKMVKALHERQGRANHENENG